MTKLRLFLLDFFILFVDFCVKCSFLLKNSGKMGIIAGFNYLILSSIILICLLLFNVFFYNINRETATKINKYTVVAYILLPIMADYKELIVRFSEHAVFAFWSMLPVVLAFYFIRYSENSKEA